jgi:beta-N-acetylhexosaminidase
MRDAGLMVTLKHWPGIGSAPDTHDGVATVGTLEMLEKADLIPFDALIDDGAEIVMLGHVIVPGLCESQTPATLSPNAYAYLREKGGADLVTLTDCISMIGATPGLELSAGVLAALSFGAGADWVMVGALETDLAQAAIAMAISESDNARERAEASVQRILKLKARIGLLPEDL